jgi:hypothetical protein
MVIGTNTGVWRMTPGKRVYRESPASDSKITHR